MGNVTQHLHGKRGLVVGIANADSVAYGCAAAFRRAGAELAVTYLNARAEPHVRPLADALGASIILPLDVEAPGEMAAAFAAIAERWGRLDFVVHSIAFAPSADLHGRVVDCSTAGFQRAMHVSCYSLIEMARLAEPLLAAGGTILTMTFYGAEKVVEHYNVMGPVKAALQATVRALAAELGPQGIRVHALSPGPLRTRAASGIGQFDALLADALGRTPRRALVTIDDVGETAAFLVSDAARGLTGNTVFVDGGRHIMA
jgi:enoyl-[acyl-carrier protein] reductase I